MKRTVRIGFVLVALVALGAVAAFARDVVSSGHATEGPRLVQHMVARRDVGTGGPGPKDPGNSPSKPIPTVDARAGVGWGLSGHGSPGSALPVASTSPETMVENNLKSVALSLR